MTKKDTENKPASLGAILGGRIIFEDMDEILERQVTRFGNSAHIPIPSKHLGKDTQVIIWKKQKEEDKPKKK